MSALPPKADNSADKVSDDFDLFLGVMARVMPTLPSELSQTPITSQLVGINPGGIAALAMALTGVLRRAILLVRKSGSLAQK
jgi:hypothetical protein